MRQTLNIVVYKDELAHGLEVEDKGYRYLANLVATKIDNFKTLELGSAECVDRCNLVHVQVQLLQVSKVSKNLWHESKLVSVQVEVRKAFHSDFRRFCI